MVTNTGSPIWLANLQLRHYSAPEASVPAPGRGGLHRAGAGVLAVRAARVSFGRRGPLSGPTTMAVFHDEVEIEDFQYDEDLETYFYPCPCGDNFCITKVTSGPRPLTARARFALP